MILITFIFAKIKAHHQRNLVKRSKKIKSKQMKIFHLQHMEAKQKQLIKQMIIMMMNMMTLLNIKDKNNHQRILTKENKKKQKSQNKQQIFNKNDRKARPDPERNTPKCKSPYCQNPPLDGYSFCQEHKCAVYGCDRERYSEDYYKILPICYHHKCVVQYCNNQKLDGYSYCQKCKCHANGCKSRSRAGYKYCDKHYCAVTYTKCQNERIDSKIKLCHDHKCAECNDQRLNDKRAKYCRCHTCKSCGCYEHAVTSMSYCYKHLQKH